LNHNSAEFELDNLLGIRELHCRTVDAAVFPS
jgi:hypothetical protein